MLLLALTLISLVYILVATGKDATSDKLKDQGVASPLVLKRLKRWHLLGSLEHAIFACSLGALASYCSPFLTIYWVEVPIINILLRIALYDVLFNIFRGLDYRYIGNTAWWDKYIFHPLFKEKGAIKKLIATLILTTILIILKLKLQ